MTKRARKSHVWPKAADDWYVEGEDCTTALLTEERFTPNVWDPCCGKGNTTRAARAAGYYAWGSDLRVRGMERHFLGASDYLTADPLFFASRVQGASSGYSMIYNPPFRGGAGSEAFIRRSLADPLCVKLAVFTESRFLGSEGRARGLWHEAPPNRVWWVAPRPSCPPGVFLEAGGKAAGGTPDFIWSVWDCLNRLPPGGRPEFGWVIRKSRG